MAKVVVLAGECLEGGPACTRPPVLRKSTSMWKVAPQVGQVGVSKRRDFPARRAIGRRTWSMVQEAAVVPQDRVTPGRARWEDCSTRGRAVPSWSSGAPDLPADRPGDRRRGRRCRSAGSFEVLPAGELPQVLGAVPALDPGDHLAGELGEQGSPGPSADGRGVGDSQRVHSQARARRASPSSVRGSAPPCFLDPPTMVGRDCRSPSRPTRRRPGQPLAAHEVRGAFPPRSGVSPGRGEGQSESTRKSSGLIATRTNRGRSCGTP